MCRLTLVTSGVNWEDVRYPMSLAASGFSFGPEFQQDAQTGAFDVNMGSLPILQLVQLPDNDHQHESPFVLDTLGQSHSIAKFVAQRHGMAGRDSLEQAKIDALYECCRDIQTQWYRIKRKQGGKELWWLGKSNLPDDDDGNNNNENKIRAGQDRDGRPKNSLHDFCERLEKAISASTTRNFVERTSGSPWCMGGPDPSLADVAVYHLLGTPPPSIVTGSVPSFFDGESSRVQQAYSSCPRLRESITAFGELKAVKEWEKLRPETFN